MEKSVLEIAMVMIRFHLRTDIMNIEILKYYKPNALVGLVSFSAIGIFSGIVHLGISVSILAVIGIILFLIDEYLWKIKPFSLLYWIEDFSGRYEGFLEYEYRDEKCNLKTGKLKHIKVISQTGSKICVFSFTKLENGDSSSMSQNKGMFVEKLEDGKHYQLMYNYLNEGNLELNFPPHYGTEIIKFIKIENIKHISGKYFTNRLPFQTRGKFSDMKKVSSDLSHDF